MSHGHKIDLAYVSGDTARTVAETMQALATPSRVRILSRLGAGACSVSELARDVEMEQPAVSQQLRILRHLGLVVGERRGRLVIYALHDDHVGVLLAEAIAHLDHLSLGLRSHPAARGGERMSGATPALIAAAAGVGFGHAILPDHWVPLAVIGRTQRYPLARVARLSGLAGVAHVLVSLDPRRGHHRRRAAAPLERRERREHDRRLRAARHRGRFRPARAQRPWPRPRTHDHDHDHDSRPRPRPRSRHGRSASAASRRSWSRSAPPPPPT